MATRNHGLAAGLVFLAAGLGAACSASAPSDGVEADLPSAATQAVTDELSAYAADCDSRMGASATVPSFDCDAQGIDIPVTLNGAPFNPSTDTQCDRPDMFTGQCTPHQKLVPIASTSTSTTIAICRRMHFPPGVPKGPGYDEIDVIQHNKSTGDTCFYTTTMILPDGSTRPPGSIPGKAPSPSAGVGTTGSFAFWMTPSQLASSKVSGCIQCHDNGAFIRSSFVKQVASKLPSRFVTDLGFGDNAYNLTQPYRIHGRAFELANWKAVSITLANGDTTCTRCHRMGANSFVRNGTGEVLGPASVNCYGNQAANCASYQQTGDMIPAENPSAPHWMVPGHTSFSPAILKSARDIEACAQAYREAQQTSPPGPIPSSCVASELTELCQDASQCDGPLPRICQVCSNGQTACPHHVCVNHQCGIATCP